MDCIIWGGTGQCKIVANILEVTGQKVKYVFDDSDPLPGAPIDVPILSPTDFRRLFLDYPEGGRKETHGFVVAIGNPRGQARERISGHLLANKLEVMMCIHPQSQLLSPVPYSSQVSSGAHIGINVYVGAYCIFNSLSNVEHDCVLGKAVEIGPSAVLCGETGIGDYSWIGAGATVLPHLTIGENVIVGAGSVVTKDIPDNEVWVGNPARKLRDNDIR